MDSRKPHADVLKDFVKEVFFPGMVIVEIGCGNSTLGTGASLARDGNWKYYSIDNDASRMDIVSRQFEQVPYLQGRVEFIIDDSIRGLQRVVDELDRIDLLFSDGMGNALRCFREFAMVEHLLTHDGAMVLIDNAVLSHSYNPLGRKGRVLVPYLESHPRWEVEDHPDWGDFMILATRRNDGQNHAPEEFGIHPEDWELTLAEEIKR